MFASYSPDQWKVLPGKICNLRGQFMPPIKAGDISRKILADDAD